MKNFFTPTLCLTPTQIKAYLEGQLSEEERYAVEHHLTDCELCSAAIEGYAQSYNFETDTELDELAGHFSTEQAQAAEEAQIRPLERSYRGLNRIAAAVLLLALPLAGWLYWNAQANERLYSQYFEAYSSDYLALRSEADKTPNPMLKSAMEVYQKQDYTQSLALLEMYLEKDPENTIAVFHAGVASLEEGQIRKAIQYLERVRFNDERYYEDASWYLTLAYLKAGQKTKVHAVLEDLLKLPKGYYYDRATALKNKLN